jgi:hypothetical protein
MFVVLGEFQSSRFFSSFSKQGRGLENTQLKNAIQLSRRPNESLAECIFFAITLEHDVIELSDMERARNKEKKTVKQWMFAVLRRQNTEKLHKWSLNAYRDRLNVFASRA